MSLELSGIGHTYRKGAAPVLHDIDLLVEAGESIALMGPSGSGKTTLLAIIGLLTAPTTGHLSIDGEPVPHTGEAAAAMRREQFAWVFQATNALPRRTAIENAALGLVVAGARREPAREAARAMLEAVGVGPLAEREARTLSGGELQRVCIARALAVAPRFLLADEPTGQLDQATTVSVIDALVTAKPPQTTVIIATHDPEVAARCSRIIHLRDGRIEHAG